MPLLVPLAETDGVDPLMYWYDEEDCETGEVDSRPLTGSKLKLFTTSLEPLKYALLFHHAGDPHSPFNARGRTCTIWELLLGLKWPN